MKIILLLLCNSIFVYGQVGIGTTIIEPNAQLELASNTQGMIVPRLSLSDTTNPSPLSSHIQGMIVYNINENGTSTNRVVEGLYYNDGMKWILFVPNFIKIGDIKHSFATSDHDGWYLLDGRSTSSLPLTAQTNATTFGLGMNLIDASDRFLKATDGSETIGSFTGNDTFMITQPNLPNVDFSGTTNSSGSHTHNVDSYLGIQVIGLLSTSALTLFTTQQVSKDETITTVDNTQLSGDHSHNITVNSGGTSTPVNRVPSYLTTNIFIYLAQ